ncbi:unnamed protein product [Schistosoma curassoni]|uniref:Neur_chan_LBD domain-containing protein n=1 Tax=Schistosoma curassoni TaxID=6186 RepID=A0A183JYE9_9TREM|nr:unnamed protein product [Schistosoma curassoni]
MMVEGSRQETLDPDFVLLGTRQQGVSVNLRKLVLPDELDPVVQSGLYQNLSQFMALSYYDNPHEVIIDITEIVAISVELTYATESSLP